MSSPESDADTTGFSSPNISQSTPLNVTTDAQANNTPDTTPLWLPGGQSTEMLKSTQHCPGLDMHINDQEKKRLAEIARYGLNDTPSRVTRDIRSVSYQPSHVASAKHLGDQASLSENIGLRSQLQDNGDHECSSVTFSGHWKAFGTASQNLADSGAQANPWSDVSFSPRATSASFSSNAVRKQQNSFPFPFAFPLPPQHRRPQSKLPPWIPTTTDSKITVNNNNNNQKSNIMEVNDKLSPLELLGERDEPSYPDPYASLSPPTPIQLLPNLSDGHDFERDLELHKYLIQLAIDSPSSPTSTGGIQFLNPLSTGNLPLDAVAAKLRSLTATPALSGDYLSTAAKESEEISHLSTTAKEPTTSTAVTTSLQPSANPPMIPNFFHPMNCHTAPRRPLGARSHYGAGGITAEEARQLVLRGFSPNYRGDPTLARNQSALIPPEANCSLFLVGLAADITTHELLSGIRDIGRVYATHINPPDPARGHVRSAAKVVFFERKAAERFYNLYSLTGFFTPNHPDLRVRVTWNRIRSAEMDVGGHRSRVLLISGPPTIANEEFLRAYLDTKLLYQVDEVITHGGEGGRVLVEFRFGSFRCQAEAARMALMREFGDVGVVCEYGWDPCDRVTPDE